MADPDQVALLRSGVAAWNAWRDEPGDRAPDPGWCTFARARSYLGQPQQRGYRVRRTCAAQSCAERA